MAVYPPNPKYIPTPYEQNGLSGTIHTGRCKIYSFRMSQKIKIIGKPFFQYTAIDEYSRWRFAGTFEEHSTYSSIFVKQTGKIVQTAYLRRYWTGSPHRESAINWKLIINSNFAHKF